MLWDKKNETIVNNESSEIIRMFNTEFNDLVPADKAKLDIYPEGLRKEIDATNDWVYDAINSWSSLVLSCSRGGDRLSVQMGFTEPVSRAAQRRTRPPCIHCSRP